MATIKPDNNYGSDRSGPTGSAGGAVWNKKDSICLLEEKKMLPFGHYPSLAGFSTWLQDRVSIYRLSKMLFQLAARTVSVKSMTLTLKTRANDFNLLECSRLMTWPIVRCGPASISMQFFWIAHCC